MITPDAAMRDTFAIAVLPAVFIEAEQGDSFENIAETCYRIADAMIAQREKAVSDG